MRVADLAIWTLLAVILGFVVGRYGLFGLSSYLAPSLALLILLFRRWGWMASISVFVLAFLHLFLYDAPFLVRAANALSLGSLLFAGWILKTKPFAHNRVGYGWVFLLYLAAYLPMFLTEAFLAFLFGHGQSILVLAVNHLANFLIGLGLLTVIDLQKSLFVDMNRYLLDTASKGPLE
jgi:hypothetical protein